MPAGRSSCAMPMSTLRPLRARARSRPSGGPDPGRSRGLPRRSPLATSAEALQFRGIRPLRIRPTASGITHPIQVWGIWVDAFVNRVLASAASSVGGGPQARVLVCVVDGPRLGRESGGEMANEFYTLIVVPHAKARFRKIQVSVRLTKWVVGNPPPWPRSPCPVLRSLRSRRRGSCTSSVSSAPRTRRSSRKTQEYEQNGGQAPGQGPDTSRTWSRSSASWPGSSTACRTRSGRRAASRAWTRRRPGSRSRAPWRHGRRRPRADRPVGRARGVLPGPEGAPLLDAFGLARPRLPVGRRSAIASIPSPARRTSTPASTSRRRSGTKVQAPADGVVISTGEQGRLRQRDRHRPRLRRGHALRPPLRLRGQARPARQARGRHRRSSAAPAARRLPTSTTRCGCAIRAQNPIHFILDEYRTFG